MKTIFVSLIFFLSFFISIVFSASNENLYKKLDVFGDVFDLIQKNYVEEVKNEKIIEYAINGMLQSLDPHSGYMNENNYLEMQEETEGEFGGLGIEVSMENGYIKVISPIDDTPAAKAGIKPSDYIVYGSSGMEYAYSGKTKKFSIRKDSIISAI